MAYRDAHGARRRRGNRVVDFEDVPLRLTGEAKDKYISALNEADGEHCNDNTDYVCGRIIQLAEEGKTIKQIQVALNGDPLAKQRNGRNITKMGATVIARVLQARDEDEGRGRRDSLIRFPDSSPAEQRRLQKYLPS